MTVSSIVPVNNYTGNSSATQFDFDFLIEAEEELVVRHTDSDGIITTLTLGVDYSINETGNEEGSYITFPLSTSSYDVLSEDETISLLLTLTIKQESEFKNSSYFNFTILEWTFDYIVRILQILSRQIERCVKVNEGSSSSGDDILEELNSILSTCVNAAKYTSESQEQLTSYIENIEEQITNFNTLYEEYYQNILDTDINTRLNQTQITNCVLELPNRVSLELNDGTLTLKAGSTVIYPNGLDDDGNRVFNYYTTENDITITTATSYTGIAYRALNSSGTGISGASSAYWYSGSEEPSIIVSSAYWYDTENNLIKYTSDSGSTWSGSISFPFCQVYVESGIQTKINTVFNGFGAVGNVIWVDEGVTVVIPNGRNEDGSLNNNIETQSEIIIYETTNDAEEHNLLITKNSTTGNLSYRSPNITSPIFYQDTIPVSTNQYQYWFDTRNNRWKYSSDYGANWSEYDWTGVIGTFTFGSDSITSFKMPYLKAFEAADKTDIIRTLSDNGLYTTTYTSGYYGYREYFSDEAKTNRVLLEQWGLFSGTMSSYTGSVTLLQEYSDTNYNIQLTLRNGDSPASYYGNVCSQSSYVPSETGFTIIFSSGSSYSGYWHTIGV